MKYIFYLRVSHEYQKESGLSIEAQRQICRGYIKDENPEILEFKDEGYSGALGINQRPGLFSAINMLEKNDILLVSKRDRIGRDPIVNAMIEKTVEKKKARLVSASGDVVDDNDPSSILMKRMVDAFSEYERLIIGARTRVALQIKKQKGQRMGKIPYGYRVKEDKIHLEEDEYEQSILAKIHEYKSFGWSLRTIAKHLNELNIRNRHMNLWDYRLIYEISNVRMRKEKAV